MEWFTLISTAVGAILAVGATTLNDRLKWKREQSKAQYETRSRLYSDYLADLTKTRDAIRLVARGIHAPDVTRHDAADSAFASMNLYARRYQIGITEAGPVAIAGESALRALRDIRDVIKEGHQHRSSQYNEAKIAYEARLRALMNAMRADLDRIR
jgi:hypothetical protein